TAREPARGPLRRHVLLMFFPHGGPRLCPAAALGASAARGVLGLPAQQVARLALEHLAERGECCEAHRLGAAVLEHRQIGGRDPYAVRELAHGHLPPGEHYVDVDGDRHQITSSNSACICAASTSRATAWGTRIRRTAPGWA